MRRIPSPEVGRSETTAELIARISAERDAPLRSSGRHAIIAAPAPRATAVPQQRRPRRPAADRALFPDTASTDTSSTDTVPRLAHRPRPPVRDDEASELATGPIDLTGPIAAGRIPRQRAGTRTGRGPAPEVPRPRRAPDLVVVDDVLHDPAAGESPAGRLGYVAPDAPAPRRTTRTALSIGLVAVAMVLVGSAAAGWFGGTGPAAPADPGAVTAPVAGIGVEPGPGPTGPTVPAPVDGPPAGTAAEPAAVDDVQPTGDAVPPAGSSYGY